MHIGPSRVSLDGYIIYINEQFLEMTLLFFHSFKSINNLSIVIPNKVCISCSDIMPENENTSLVQKCSPG